MAEAEGIVAAAESGRLRADAELMATFRHNADCCRAELAKAERKLKRIVQ